MPNPFRKYFMSACLNFRVNENDAFDHMVLQRLLETMITSLFEAEHVNSFTQHYLRHW